MTISAPLRLLSGALFLAVAILGWRILSTDPHSAFLADVEEMVAQTNQGEHLSLRSRLSPEAESLLTNNYMSAQQALLMARKMDTDRNILYRLAQLSVFYPSDYAEVEIERSAPGADFSNPQRFPVPFIYQKGDWLVAGGFRGERDFSNPFD